MGRIAKIKEQVRRVKQIKKRVDLAKKVFSNRGKIATAVSAVAGALRRQ